DISLVVEDQLSRQTKVHAVEPDGAGEPQFALHLANDVENVEGVVLVGEVFDQELIRRGIDGADQQGVEEVPGAQVLDLVRGRLHDGVGSDHEAVPGGKEEFEVGTGGHHIERLGAHHRKQADDPDGRRLAKENVAADIFVFGDLAFLGAAEHRHEVHGGV